MKLPCATQIIYVASKINVHHTNYLNFKKITVRHINYKENCKKRAPASVAAYYGFRFRNFMFAIQFLWHLSKTMPL